MKKSVCSQIDGLFADSLLKYAGVVPDGAHAQIASVMEAARSGHLCMQIDDLSLLPSQLVERVDEQSSFPSKPLCLYGNLLYLQKNWIFETRVLKHIKRLQKDTCRTVSDVKELSSDLNAEQRAAVSNALTCRVSLITGGPGTGKTYTAARLIAAFLKTRRGRVAVAAPTGKAASGLERALSNIMKVSSEVTLGTVHALLGQRLRSEEEIPLPFKLIIIDESSMIDAPLFAALLSSVSQDTHLVLMGDPDQLPPVEVGSLFADILFLNLFPSTCLIQCMRSKNPILQLAASIRSGQSEEAIHQIKTDGLFLDLGFAKRCAYQIYEKLWTKVNDRFSSSYSKEPDHEHLLHNLAHFRILSCLRSGLFGVDALNQYLVKRFYMEAREGDFVALPIIVTRNDPELELFNGQMGVLVKKKEGSQLGSMTSDDTLIFPERRLSAALMTHFEYAYCLSVHKAQGSEYDEVLLLVPQGSENFGREVLYTAVTRAKQTLSIDGDLEIIKEAIETSSRKHSGLKSRLSLV